MKNIQKEQIIKKNARTQKWRVMLANGLHKDPSLLKSRTRKGIPMSIRILAWPQLINLEKTIEVSKHNYQKLANSFSNNVYEIGLDIPRTFPQQEDSKYLKKSMNNVLKAISIVHPKIGYCQGMNFFTLRILQILNDQITFWMLHHLLLHDPELENHFSDPKSIEKQNYVFQQLLQEKLPKIYNIFKESKMIIQAFTVKWFMTLFSNVLSQQLFNRLFEVFLLQGWPIIYAVGLAIFKNKEKSIEKCTVQQIMYMMNSQLYKIEDYDAFMNIAYDMNITNKKVDSLIVRYFNNKSEHYSEGRRSLQIRNREQANRIQKKYLPQNQQIQMLQFQNKSAELYFQHLQLLKVSKMSKIQDEKKGSRVFYRKKNDSDYQIKQEDSGFVIQPK